jgi:hypothetical protein
MDNAPRANFKLDPSAIANARAMGQQLQYSKAQTDNVLADTANKQLDQDLKNAQINQTNVQTANIAQNTATSEFQLAQSQQLKDSVLERAQLENESLKVKNVVQLGEYELAQIKSASDKSQVIQNIAESKQRILTSQLQNAQLPLQKQKIEAEIAQMQQIQQNTQLDEQIKRIELELRQQGVQPNDNIWNRKIWEGIQNWQNKDAQWLKEYKKKTYGGREGFDAEGNPQTLYRKLTQGK